MNTDPKLGLQLVIVLPLSVRAPIRVWTRSQHAEVVDKHIQVSLLPKAKQWGLCIQGRFLG